jgi:hypothetical protein
MALMIPPPVGELTYAAIAGGAILAGVSSAADKGCIPGVSGS